MTCRFYLDWCEPAQNLNRHPTETQTCLANICLDNASADHLEQLLTEYSQSLHGRTHLGTYVQADLGQLTDELHKNGAAALSSEVDQALVKKLKTWLKAKADRSVCVCTNSLGFTAIKVTGPNPAKEDGGMPHIAQVIGELIRRLFSTTKRPCISFQLDTVVIKAGDGNADPEIGVRIAEKLTSLRPVPVEPPETEGQDVAVHQLLERNYLVDSTKGQSPLSKLASRYAQTIDRALEAQKSLINGLTSEPLTGPEVSQ